MIVNMNVNVVRKRLLLSMPIFPGDNYTAIHGSSSQLQHKKWIMDRLDENVKW